MITILALTLHVRPADAHALDPSLLELREGNDDIVDVLWRQPSARVPGSDLRPVLPASCQTIEAPRTTADELTVSQRWKVSCPGGFVGATIAVDGMEASQTNALIRLVLHDGRTIRHALRAGDPSFVVPEREGANDVLASYGRLGVEHILTGFDHLLFVLGLVLLVGGGSRLLWTVTAFTLGHSVTLALAVLGFVHVPQRLTEAVIALTIYLLAVELTRSGRGTLFHRWPWLMAGLFGMLHGFGFAGALNEVGLPAADIPLALFSFNAGIEAGQLAFVAVVLSAWSALRAMPVHWPALVTRLPAYAIGSLAAFWFLERSAAALHME